MSVSSLIRQPCVITIRTQTGPPDEFGTPTWQETDTPSVIHVQPVSSEEVEDRPAGRFTHRGYLKVDADVPHSSKITLVSGQSWEVDGPPQVWHNPRTGRDEYQVVDLIGFTG